MRRSVIAVLTLLLFAATASAEVEGQSRHVEEFNSIVAANSYVVHYAQSDRYRLFIDTTDEVVLKKTIVSMVGRTLYIKYDGVQLSPVDVYVESPEINRIELSGSASFLAETPISAPWADFRVKGTGSLTLQDLITTIASLEKSGTGRFAIEGTLVCDTLMADLSGAGSLALNKITSVISSISATGTCSAKLSGLTQTQKLIATMVGAGKIEITGEVIAKETVRLELQGVGQVNATGHLYTERLLASMEGTGAVRATDIECDLTEAKIRGIGVVKLGGVTERLLRDQTGFGKIDTDNLKINEK